MLVVLASQSPRRREILTFAGIPHRVQAAGVEEIRAPGELAAEYVRRLAADKARAITAGPDEIVLAADTTVVVDSDAGEIVLEKPADAAEAKRMMGLLSGGSHRVLTGICLRHSGVEVIDLSVTTVRFARLSALEIDEYVASGESMDKAGGYAIQGRAAKFVRSIDGCYFNVMGLPIALVYEHLKTFQY
jgi:septum formation protein